MKAKIKKEIIGLILILSLLGLVSCTTISDDINTNITIFGGMYCNYTTSQWWDYNLYPFPLKTNSMNDCYRNYGIPGPKCCPSGFECVNSSGKSTSTGQEIWNCTSTGKVYCWDYKSSQDECRDNNGRKDVAEVSWRFKLNNPSYACAQPIRSDKFKNASGEWFYNETHCECKWNNNNCSAELIVRTIHIDPYCSDCGDSNNVGNCTINVMGIDDFCADRGVLIWRFSATRYGNYPEPCENSERSISCETVAKMDFFGTYNIMCVIIILVAVYSFLIINNKRFP